MKCLLVLMLFVGLSCGIPLQSTNAAAVSLIKSFEGFFPNFYIDPVGIRTVGYGHACHVWDCNKLIAKNSAGATRTVRTPLSEQDAADLLRNDLSAGGFEKCVADGITVPLNGNQYGALVSFAFNVGCGGFKSSSLRTVINNNQFNLVREKFLLWVKGGGVTLPGLVRRRNAEADLFGGSTSGSGGSDSSTGQSCTQTSTGETGVCMASTSCQGTVLTGLCAGDSSIRCCVNQPCGSGSNQGLCKAESRCSGTSQSGLCPGDATIKCCVSSTPAAPVQAFCPTGASFDPSSGFCASSEHLYGPFSQQMTDKCVANGGGDTACKGESYYSVQGTNGVQIKVQRWAKTFALNIRGSGDCPLGASTDSNYLGHCVETLSSGSKNVFGPFSTDLVNQCKAASGGSACYSNRWGAAFFRALATGASTGMDVTYEGSPDDVLDFDLGIEDQPFSAAPSLSPFSFFLPLFSLFVPFLAALLL